MTRILIVDDEPLAREVLQRYIAACPDLHLAGSCANAYEAQDLLRAEPVHILLCDIKMPEVDGLALIRSLTHQPRIILTTAHPEYALESYDIGVVDYLMKPIAFDRFLKALRRAIVLPDKPVLASHQHQKRPGTWFQRHCSAGQAGTCLTRKNFAGISVLQGGKNVS